MAQMTKAFVGDIHRIVDAHNVPLVHFAKGQRKDDVMQSSGRPRWRGAGAVRGPGAGEGFLKFCSYVPFTTKLCIN
jgi:hypothetical protein